MPSLDGGLGGVPQSRSAWNVIDSVSDCVQEQFPSQIGLFCETICQHVGAVDESELLNGPVVIDGLLDVDDIRLKSVVSTRFHVVDRTPQITAVCDSETLNFLCLLSQESFQ